MKVLQPGPELDAMIVEKVMGWKICFTDPTYGFWIGEHYRTFHDFKPSTSIAHAWEVVEKMGMVTIEDGGESVGKPEWSVGFVDTYGDWIHGEGSTAPHAICLAALKAMGEEI